MPDKNGNYSHAEMKRIIERGGTMWIGTGTQRREVRNVNQLPRGKELVASGGATPGEELANLEGEIARLTSLRDQLTAKEPAKTGKEGGGEPKGKGEGGGDGDNKSGAPTGTQGGQGGQGGASNKGNQQGKPQQ